MRPRRASRLVVTVACHAEAGEGRVSGALAKFASAGWWKSWYKLTSTFGIAPSRGRLPELNAGIAQLVEQLICNQQVVGSNPTAGFLVKS
jgi:hypothetical protein